MENEEESGLLPCPFCKSEAVIDTVFKRIYCTGCPCKMEADVFTTMPELLLKWQDRKED